MAYVSCRRTTTLPGVVRISPAHRHPSRCNRPSPSCQKSISPAHFPGIVKTVHSSRARLRFHYIRKTRHQARLLPTLSCICQSYHGLACQFSWANTGPELFMAFDMGVSRLSLTKFDTPVYSVFYGSHILSFLNEDAMYGIVYACLFAYQCDNSSICSERWFQ